MNTFLYLIHQSYVYKELISIFIPNQSSSSTRFIKTLTSKEYLVLFPRKQQYQHTFNLSAMSYASLNLFSSTPLTISPPPLLLLDCSFRLVVFLSHLSIESPDVFIIQRYVLKVVIYVFKDGEMSILRLD